MAYVHIHILAQPAYHWIGVQIGARGHLALDEKRFTPPNIKARPERELADRTEPELHSTL